jgi:stage IV sporulation protein FB
MLPVFMQEPDPTPFDLNWRMFGVPVRVHPFFWVLAAFLGWNYFNSDRAFGIVLWIGCVFLSILLHEFGHVFAGRMFGSEGRILLYAFGGLAIGSSNLRRRWQRVVVYLAGPAVQLVLAGAVYILGHYVLRGRVPQDQAHQIALLLTMLLEINLLWGIFNLLPITPLDGGQVTREICDIFAPGRGAIYALGTSTVVCAGVAVLILLESSGRGPELPRYIRGYMGMYNAMLFAMFAASSFQALQIERARRNWDDRFPWER